MSETWTIEGNNTTELIEGAVNTALGMSLLYPVEVTVRNDPPSVTVDAGNGDSGVIPCDSQDDARWFAIEIFAAVERELAEMPPFGMRKPIRLQVKS